MRYKKNKPIDKSGERMSVNND